MNSSEDRMEASSQAIAGAPSQQASQADRSPGGSVASTGRAVLEWFGVDVASVTLALDPTRTCLDVGCNRRAMLGELVCPVHLGVVTAQEMPDYRSLAASRSERLSRTLILAGLLGLGGFGLGVAVGDLRFGWLGGLAAGAVVAAFASKELRFLRLSSLLGLIAFFAATVLVFSGILVSAIATLPWLIGHLLG